LYDNFEDDSGGKETETSEEGKGEDKQTRATSKTGRV
jgi:hypothetical protein